MTTDEIYDALIAVLEDSGAFLSEHTRDLVQQVADSVEV